MERLQLSIKSIVAQQILYKDCKLFAQALYEVRVHQTGDLLLAPFRFCIIADTPALS